MTDWATISALATAGGTLVLAAATYSSVRSGNRAARVAERAFQAGSRPVLFPSRTDDLTQKLMWMEGHWEALPGAGGVAHEVDDVIYLAMSLRNVGQGIAVLRGWIVGERVVPDATPGGHAPVVVRPEVEMFRPQGRDLYVAANDTAFWQAAIRGRQDPLFESVSRMVRNRETLSVDLLYGDHEGGQRAISRFAILPHPRGEDDGWLISVVRHWNLDRDDPR